MNLLPVLLKDGYKVDHRRQYPPGTTMIYSNLTPRRSRIPGVDEVVAFGFQYFVEEYLIRQFKKNFFDRPLDEVLASYARRITNYLGSVEVDHIEALHRLGYLPLRIKAVPEGTLVPMRVPMLTIRNTHPDFFWLTNMLETLMANVLWLPCTSATTALRYRRAFEQFAVSTGADREFIPWQGHDFSFRGLPGVEAAMLSGAAHLLSFTGTDTIPAIDFLEEYYEADSDEELVGGSVPATEHSVMCMGLEDGELETFERLLKLYPTGIVSVVSDSWDFWRVLTEYLPKLKDEIMQRDGKLVIRPDSGDPYLILCGENSWSSVGNGSASQARRKGAVETLWDLFGGTTTSTGHKVLDPHIGLIYGDSITPDLQVNILSGLAQKGFASSNVVFGIGSYTYQYTTRDTYGFAIKSTFGVRNGIGQSIFKEPATDDGLKNSARGLLYVGADDNGKLFLEEDVNWNREDEGVLRTIFFNGEPRNLQTLEEIRALVNAQLSDELYEVLASAD